MHIGPYAIRSEIEDSIRSAAGWPEPFEQICRMLAIAVGLPGAERCYTKTAADYLAAVAQISHRYGRSAKKVKREIRRQRRRHFREVYGVRAGRLQRQIDDGAPQRRLPVP